VGFARLLPGQRGIETAAIDLQGARHRDAERVRAKDTLLCKAHAEGVQADGIRIGHELIAAEIELADAAAIGNRCDPAFTEAYASRNPKRGGVGAAGNIKRAWNDAEKRAIAGRMRRGNCDTAPIGEIPAEAGRGGSCASEIWREAVGKIAGEL